MARTGAPAPHFHGGRNASRCRYARSSGRRLRSGASARAVSVGNDAFRPLDLAGAEQWLDGQSGGVPDPFVRHLDAGLPAGHAGHHAFAPSDLAAAGALRRMCGLFAFFYGFPFHGLGLVGPGIRPWADAGRYRRAALHHRGLCRLCADGGAGGTSAVGHAQAGQTLAAPARAVYAIGLLAVLHYWWHKAAERPGTTHDLRRRAGGAAGLAGGRMVAASFLSAGGCRPPLVVLRAGGAGSQGIAIMIAAVSASGWPS